jgi:acyl-homoserine-lactone acylase
MPISVQARYKLRCAWVLLIVNQFASCLCFGQAVATPASGARISGPQSTAQCTPHALIRRDRFGVPHILADTEEAAAYAHGYVTAQDHGAVLARAILRAQGKLASEFGPEFLDQDVLVRTLHIHETAAERFHELSPLMQSILNAYARGYNQYLTNHRTEFPGWAAPVSGVDLLAHARAAVLLDFALDLRPWNQSGNDKASNMWVIAPAISASKHALLLANPHLGWNSKVPLHEVQLTVPGIINVSGAAFIGTPVVSIGFNDSLGWSHTANYMDSDDVYELTLDPTGTKYAYNDEYLPLTSQPLSIEVRSGNTVTVEHRTALWSHYGPIIRIKDGKAYAYKSANLDLVNFLTEYNQMAKATSLKAFMAAVDMQQLPMFNIGYADKAGNIWFLYNGRIPIRPPGYDWAGIVPGNSDKTEWFAVWPISALPQLLNPKSGYIQNCNGAPWYTNREELIDRTPYREYLPIDGVTWRGMFSLEVLSKERSMTLDKLMDYKYNSTLVIAERVKPDLITALRQKGEQWGSAADLLEHWDNTVQANSRGAVLFLAWWEEYANSLERPFKIPFDHVDPTRTPSGLADPVAALEAFARAAADVKHKYGTLDVSWGKIHRARRGTLDLPVGGSDDTFERLSYQPQPDGEEVAVAGDTYTLAVEFGDSPRAFSVVPYSEASSPNSPYYNNQLQIYVEHKFKPAWFSEVDISEHLDRQYCPAP